MIAEENNCLNCMSLKRGECCGGKSVCEFFKYSPSINEGQKKIWRQSNRFSDTNSIDAYFPNKEE